MGGRLYLAFTKKIRLLCEHLHLVTQCHCSNLPRSSSNLVEKTMILLDTARILSPDFFKKCQIPPISQVQWQIANLFWNSNLLIQWVFFWWNQIWLNFFDIKRFVPQCEQREPKVHFTFTCLIPLHAHSFISKYFSLCLLFLM